MDARQMDRVRFHATRIKRLAETLSDQDADRGTEGNALLLDRLEHAVACLREALDVPDHAPPDPAVQAAGAAADDVVENLMRRRIDPNADERADPYGRLGLLLLRNARRSSETCPCGAVFSPRSLSLAGMERERAAFRSAHLSCR